MSDFLQFLNTANEESLTKLSGITPSLAESLIAARPFDEVDDCLKVKGMGKNLLARAQASFEQLNVEHIQAERALIPVEQEDRQDVVMIEEKPQAKEEPSQNIKPSFRERLGQATLWFFRTLLRLILIVLVVGGIGAAIYYGVPYINDRFIVPVERNTAQMTELENEIKTLQTQLTDINRQIVDVKNQLNNANQKLAENQDSIEQLRQAVDGHTATLTELANMQKALEEQLKENNNRNLLALKQEVMLTRALDMLARARLYLAQSNFGLARADVQSTHDLLMELQAESQDEVRSQAIERLEMTLSNLPDFPVIASGDLEIAWQILMTGESVPTPTPESTPETTITPEATPEVTPGATATP